MDALLTFHTYRNPKNETAIEAVNAFAAHLAGRFSPIVGCTRSWDSADPTDFQVCHPQAGTSRRELTHIFHRGRSSSTT